MKNHGGFDRKIDQYHVNDYHYQTHFTGILIVGILYQSRVPGDQHMGRADSRIDQFASQIVQELHHLVNRSSVSPQSSSDRLAEGANGIVRDEHHQLKLNQGEKQAKLKRSMGHPRNMDEVLEQRDIAFWQSVLSAVLSLTVGMIIYEAKDANCMPLVVALYTVVGMSMKNVISFFSTIDNNPASDAVALLSFNCFILGTLTYPTLPKVVRILGSLA
ncbi:hypothetical protein LINPERPRIM_LOCUS26421 [Linum perenne]